MGRYPALLIGIVVLLGVLLTSAIHVGTRSHITRNQQLAKEQPLRELIRATDVVLDDSLLVDDRRLLGLRQPTPAYRARRGNEIVAVILPVTAPDGYGGPIQLQVGIHADGTVSGIRLLSHRETPGIGDRIAPEKSSWLQQFTGRSLLSPPAEQWTVQKNGGSFDQLTGATVTPRAVTAAIGRALQYFSSHRPQLLDNDDRTNGENERG